MLAMAFLASFSAPQNAILANRWHSDFGLRLWGGVLLNTVFGIN